MSVSTRCHRARRGLYLLAAAALLAAVAAAGLVVLVAGARISPAVPPTVVVRSETRVPIPAPAETPRPPAPVEPVRSAPPVVVPPVTPPTAMVPTSAVPPPGPPLLAPAGGVGALEPAWVEPAGRYKAGDTFDLEVTVGRRSAVSVLGVEVAQWARYALASTVTISRVNPDGSLVAEQVVRTGRLLDADAGMREPLAAALALARGARLTVAVDSTGTVTAIEVPKDPLRVLAGGGPGQQSLRLWSLLDADAWKELAGLAFFQPDKPPAPGATWGRDIAHDWGPLGSWRGRTAYAVAKKPAGKPGPERVEYRHDIYHRPPPGADGGLPFRVLRAEFKPVAAGGAVLYDPATRRATAAEETFRVRGAVLASVGGVEAATELEELQTFGLTVAATAERALVGRPVPRPANK